MTQDDLKKLLADFHNKKNRVREQAALYGTTPPLEVQSTIDNYDRAINLVNQRIKEELNDEEFKQELACIPIPININVEEMKMMLIEASQSNQSGKIDPVLKGIVKMAAELNHEFPDFQYPVTISVNGGLLVSGLIIGSRRYAQELYKRIMLSVGDPNPNIEELERKLEIDGSALPKTDLDPEYIHLQNAHIFLTNTGSIPHSNTFGFLWRSKLESIDSFMIGKLEIS